TLLSITSPDGAVTDVGITDGLLTSVTNPKDPKSSISETYALAYWPNTDLLKTFTKPDGQATTFTYDDDGLLLKESHSGGHTLTLAPRVYTSSYAYSTTQTTGLNRQTKTLVTNTLSGAEGDYRRQESLPSGTNVVTTQQNVQLTTYRGGVSTS